MIKQNLKHLTMPQLKAIKENQYRSKNCKTEYCEESVNERIWELASKTANKMKQEEPQFVKTIFPPPIKKIKQINDKKEPKKMTFQFINDMARPNLIQDIFEDRFTIIYLTVFLSILTGGLFL